MTPEPGTQANDVTRRTHLANERTYLAWWRTGLASLAVAIGAGRVVPVLTKAPRWPYLILGAVFALMGIVCIGYSYVRHRQVEEALAKGEFSPPDDRVVAGLTIAGAVAGLIVLAIVLFNG
jgi:putative membrane protein